MKSESSEKKALIRYRMKRARSTLRASQLLYKQGGDPASIVNRAYYAMFYAALALLVTIGQESSKHQGVLSLFDQHFIKAKILPKEMGKFCTTRSTRGKSGIMKKKPNLPKNKQIKSLSQLFSLST